MKAVALGGSLPGHLWSLGHLSASAQGSGRARTAGAPAEHPTPSGWPQLASSVGSWRTPAPAFPFTHEGSHSSFPCTRTGRARPVFSTCLGCVLRHLASWVPASQRYLCLYTPALLWGAQGQCQYHTANEAPSLRGFQVGAEPERLGAG